VTHGDPDNALEHIIMIVNEARNDVSPALAPRAWLVVRRRRGLIALSMVLAMGTAMAGYATTPPTFVSEVVLVLDMRRVQPIPNETVVNPLPQDSPVLRTQLDIIGSRMLAADVLDKLEADGAAVDASAPLPAVNPWLPAWILDWWRSPSVVREPAESESEPTKVVDPRDRRSKIEALLSNLRVTNDGRSYTIFINYRASDPDLAARTANAFAQAYLDHQVDVQQTANRRVSDWLGETLVGLHAQLEKSEVALERFRQQAGLVQANGSSLQVQSVAAGNQELTVVRTALAGAQARLDAVRRLARDEDMPALAEFLASPTIQTLRSEQARVERALEALERSGAVKNRQIAALTSEQTSLEEQIAVEVGRIVESLANETAIAEQKKNGLERRLEEAQAELAKANKAALTAAQLEREANANRMIYESYLVRYKQTIEQDGFVLPEAQMISRAEPASARAAPRLSNWILLGLASGFGIAFAGVALGELTDRRLRLVRGIEATTGLPILGSVPRLRHSAVASAMAAANPSTPFGGALAQLRLMLRSGHKSVICLTAPARGRGTSSLALGLARSAAAAGIRAVVVDADLRRPSLARIAGLTPHAYLDEILDMRGSPDRLLHDDPGSNARIIPARAGASSPEHLLRSASFRALMSSLRAGFDLVILDTPGLQQSTDAAILAPYADRTLFVVRGDVDSVEGVSQTIRRFAVAGLRPDGFVINRIDADLEQATALRTFFSPLRELPDGDSPAGQPEPLMVKR
jgi:uncharacterized protein involved in exopolysaccharide biosynthesis/Mrp family chromosome partitioning ATPase